MSKMTQRALLKGVGVMVLLVVKTGAFVQPQQHRNTHSRRFTSLRMSSAEKDGSWDSSTMAGVLAAAMLLTNPDPSFALRRLDMAPVDIPDQVRPGMKIDSPASTPDYLGSKPQWMKTDKAPSILVEPEAADEPANPPAQLDPPAAPKFQAPAMPAFEAPKFDFKMPEVPKVELPSAGGGADSVDAPAAPKFQAPAMPAFEAPKFDFKMPEVPKVELPSAGGGADSVDDISDLSTERAAANAARQAQQAETNEATLQQASAQRDKDAAAKAASEAFKAKVAEVKIAEKQVQALKEEAQSAKREAQKQKDIACETRPGGKVLCLRSPFDSSTDY